MDENVNALIAALQPIISRVRTDVSAVKTPDGSRWTRISITPQRLAKHLNGGPARGVSPIKAGESVTLAGLLDLDSHKGETPWPEMVGVVERVMAELKRHGLVGIPFRSFGGAGIHIYVLWEAPQDAYSVRCLLIDALAALGYKNGCKGVSKGEIEIFPKQDSVPAEGFGNQFILPLAGQSVPLEPLLGLEPMDREYVLSMDWPVSEPVPVRERPARGSGADSTASTDVDLAKVRSALAAIPNEGDAELGYDDWWKLMAALHTIDDGGPVGWELAHEFSARASKRLEDPEHLAERVWPYLRDEGREKRINLDTLYWMAGQHGWTPPPAQAEEFDVVPVIPGVGQDIRLPDFERLANGKIKPIHNNLYAALARPELCGWQIRFDAFLADIMLAPVGTDEWRALADEHYTDIALRLERGLYGFAPIGPVILRSVVRYVAKENAFDSAQLWLNSLCWDGVPRIDAFLSRYFGAEDTPYRRAVSAYWWTACAGRVLDPGCQADMVVILVGAQGILKSSAVKAVVPGAERYREINLADRDVDTARLIRGCLVGEIAELRGLNTRDIESIKAFITRTHENWTPKYLEQNTTYARRCIFIGTTNAQEFLADATGERRFLPVEVRHCDIEAIKRDRDQLWAEAAARWMAGGVEWRGAERLAGAEHAKHKVCDPWHDMVASWLDAKPDELDSKKKRNGDGFVPTADILRCALSLRASECHSGAQRRVSVVMERLGYRKYRESNFSPRGWVLAENSET